MRIKNKIIISIPVIIFIISITFLIINSLSKKEIIITGIVETTEIDVSSKIPGRIDTILVKEGDIVRKGDILAKLESKELDAKLEQAKGAMEAAKSKMTLIKKGVRKEEKEAAEKLYLQAKSQYEYALKTWERFKKLYQDGVISSQEMDEIDFKYKAALNQMEAAKAKYDMALNGARQEEIDAAESLFHQAENAYKEALAYYDELKIKAPVSGEVYKIISDEGEIINSGYPIFTLLKNDDSYIVIQLREDLMNNIKLNKIVKGKIPSLGNKEYEFKITYIAPMADFATWKPTNQKGEFDLKTFEIHLRSINPIKELRPGMTVNISL
ncbi:MAG: biotin/lipoyl-binding protein [Melioribacteraceae bacterium]